MAILAKNRLNMSIRENVECDPKDVKLLLDENSYLEDKIEKYKKMRNIDISIIYGLFITLLVFTSYFLDR